ncbi:MAG: transposase [Blastocatellia bacterium]|nr:transposase [Blastocatellia bacterium]
MRAFKYKLKPSARIEAMLWQWLRVCRELYNSGLHERREAWRLQRISLNYVTQAAELPEVKAGRDDVARVNAQVLQDVLRRLEKAFAGFFRRVKAGETPGFPRFQGANRYDSFTFPQAKGAFRLEGRFLHLSKIGKVKLHLSRPLAGIPKTCTLKREADGWYAVITCETAPKPALPETGQAVGIDLGLESFARLDDDRAIENPRFLKTAERRLKTAQRAVSRKRRGSRNRRKAVRLLARHHQRIERQRRDFFFKTANALVAQYDRIAVEDLNIKGMVKNHHLAKAIHDAAWHSFILILSEKAAWAGRKLVKVNARFSSSDCSQCGHRVRKSLSEREHRCIACGFVAQRDTNAALEIKARGLRVWGEAGLPASVNHEPARRPTGNLHP